MDSSQHNRSDIPRLIWIIGSPIIFTVGVLGNVLTISVLSRPNYKKSSTSVFLMFLAVADMLVVTTLLPRWWIIYMFGIDIRHVNNVFCKLHWFFTYFNGCFSNAILVAVTIERIISILRPYKVKAWCTVNNAIVTSITIIVFWIALNGYILHGMKLFSVSQYVGINDTIQCLEDESHFMNEISSKFDRNTGNESVTALAACNITNRQVFEGNRNGNRTTRNLLNVSNSTTSNRCFNISVNSMLVLQEAVLKTSNCELILRHVNTFSMCWFDDPTFGKFYLGIYQVVFIVIYYAVTEVSILVGIIVILHQLAASRKLRKRMRLRVTRESSMKLKKSTFESHSAQITRSLLLVNAVFLSCVSPVHIFLLGRTEWIDENTGMTETQEIIWAVFNMLFYINHAINFVLYFLSGSKFRKQVKRTLRCNCRKDSSNGSSLSQYINREMNSGCSSFNNLQNIYSISQF